MTHERWMHVAARRVAVVLASVLVGSVAILWSWNVVAHDLFGGPQAEYRHALAAITGLIVIALTLRFGPARLPGSADQNK